MWQLNSNFYLMRSSLWEGHLSGQSAQRNSFTIRTTSPHPPERCVVFEYAGILEKSTLLEMGPFPSRLFAFRFRSCLEWACVVAVECSSAGEGNRINQSLTTLRHKNDTIENYRIIQWRMPLVVSDWIGLVTMFCRFFSENEILCLPVVAFWPLLHWIGISIGIGIEGTNVDLIKYIFMQLRIKRLLHFSHFVS